ncbi:MAG: 4Fe-4S dicluster domain-containing protein [Bacteriovoracaceae bacterium]|nr:4Fe-4S dicluster domain-containing protein [Bacteriovoracaceae bacterium]
MNEGQYAATREIMWNIPSWFGYFMYAFFVIGVIFLVKGLYQHLQLVTGNKGIKVLMPEKLQWGKFFKTLLLQGKVTRTPLVGIFHGAIFFGFAVLVVATILVGIEYDTPIRIYHGFTYKFISLLADISAVAIIIGIFIAYYRRYIKKESFLEATNPKRERWMYGILLNLVIGGLLLEGIRILGNDMPLLEKHFSPVGYALALVFSKLGLSSYVWSIVHRVIWVEHMVLTMIFIGIIPKTKFFHIIFAPFNALITPAHRAATLLPMNFEDEEAETFGLGKISELTHKDKLDVTSCVECGRCTNVCPAFNSDKNLNPKTVITKMRDFIEKNVDKDATFWEENPLYTANELDACTTCGACIEECPMSIEHLSIIVGAKRYKVLTLGEIPELAADAANKCKINGNPWGITQDDRFKWADGLDIPIISPDKKVEYLYFVGCAGSYDADNQKVVKDTLALLKAANVDFALMGTAEKCCSDPVRRFGDEYSAFEIILENVETINQYKFDKIVTHCPHCLHTLGKEYLKFDDWKHPVIHHSELLLELVKAGKLVAKKELDETLTFHDPCYIGRHKGQYQAPREILKTIPKLTLKEMEKNKDRATCCGMGGGNMWYELPEGKHLALNRLEEVAKTKAPKVATACTYCLINFNSSKDQCELTSDLEVEDVASILAKSVL